MRIARFFLQGELIFKRLINDFNAIGPFLVAHFFLIFDNFKSFRKTYEKGPQLL